MRIYNKPIGVQDSPATLQTRNNSTNEKPSISTYMYNNLSYENLIAKFNGQNYATFILAGIGVVN